MFHRYSQMQRVSRPQVQQKMIGEPRRRTKMESRDAEKHKGFRNELTKSSQRPISSLELHLACAHF